MKRSVKDPVEADMASVTLSSLIWQLDGWSKQFGDRADSGQVSAARAGLSSLLKSIDPQVRIPPSEGDNGPEFIPSGQTGPPVPTGPQANRTRSGSESENDANSEQSEERDSFPTETRSGRGSLRRIGVAMSGRRGADVTNKRPETAKKIVPEGEAETEDTAYQKLTNCVPIFMEDNNYRLCWDVYMMALIIYYAIAVPVRVGFDIDPQFLPLENFFSACFGLDILINFNTSVNICEM